MLSHEHELRWWQPKASGERTVGGFLTSRDFANSKSMNAFVEDCKKGSLLIFSQFPSDCTMLQSCFLFTFSLQTSKVLGTSRTVPRKYLSSRKLKQIFGYFKLRFRNNCSTDKKIIFWSFLGRDFICMLEHFLRCQSRNSSFCKKYPIF